MVLLHDEIVHSQMPGSLEVIIFHDLHLVFNNPVSYNSLAANLEMDGWKLGWMSIDDEGAFHSKEERMGVSFRGRPRVLGA